MKRTHFSIMAALATAISTLLASPAGAQDAPEKKEEAKRVLFTNVRIFNGVDEKFTEGRVLVENNLITAVGEKVKAPQGATVIDGGGRTLMPGLIDVHTHVAGTANPTEIANWRAGYLFIRSVPSAKRMLLRGFTTIRDVGVSTTDLARATLTKVTSSDRGFCRRRNHFCDLRPSGLPKCDGWSRWIWSKAFQCRRTAGDVLQRRWGR
jgi:hypothetical protein